MRMSKNNQQSNKSIKSSTPLKEGIERRLESDTISEDVSLRGDTAKKSQVGNGIAVKVTNVSKTFKIPHKKIDSMKSAFVNFFKKNTYEEFYALKDISVEVKKGEFLGIIGHNGAGKSTLLKILAGVYQPTSGSIEVNGMISPFLELGIGFNPELSGRDNIYLNATVLGLTKKQIDKKFDEIVQFAELEKFIDEQLKNYSSGMKARLAFSVSIHADREILIMDEVLAVGDSRFQEKCLDIFKGYKDNGKTVILVTHSMATVREYCDRALLLHKGKLLGSGDVDEICDEYILKNMTESQKRGIEKKEKIEAQEKEREKKIKTKGMEIKRKERIALMAELLPTKGTVLDFGCGKMWLREFIDESNITYKGLDYVSRDKNTIVCDINSESIPEIDYNIAFLSGFLEYVDNPQNFINQIAKKANTVVVSYCTTDNFPELDKRIERTWKNHLADADIVNLFDREDYELVKKNDYRNTIYVFEKKIIL